MRSTQEEVEEYIFSKLSYYSTIHDYEIKQYFSMQEKNFINALDAEALVRETLQMLEKKGFICRSGGPRLWKLQDPRDIVMRRKHDKLK